MNEHHGEIKKHLNQERRSKLNGEIVVEMIFSKLPWDPWEPYDLFGITHNITVSQNLVISSVLKTGPDWPVGPVHPWLLHLAKFGRFKNWIWVESVKPAKNCKNGWFDFSEKTRFVYSNLVRPLSFHWFVKWRYFFV